MTSVEPHPVVALADTPVVSLGDGRYEVDLPASWVALQGVHGGYGVGLAVRAVQRDLDDPARSLRAATFGFLRGLRPEPATIEVTPVRVGRALATYHLTISQGGGAPSVVGRCHLSPPWEGTAFSDLVVPPALPPDDAVRLTTPGDVGHVRHLPTWVHPDTTMFAGAPEARWLAWTRPSAPDSVDGPWLTMLGDYFPPAVCVRETTPTRAVSIEYAIQVHTSADPFPLGPDEVLACTMHTTHAAEGLAIEDGTIWGPDGTLVATTRQTKLAG